MDVDTHAAIGSVTYGGSGPQAFLTPTGPAPSVFGPPRPRLTVDAQVGIGQVQLVRGES